MRKSKCWRAVRCLASVMLFIAASLTIVPGAQASKYYGIAWLYGTNFHGGFANIRSNAISVPNPESNFANDEMWVASESKAYWTEAGITVGCVAGVCYGNNPLFYWADSRPGGGYHEHAGGSAALNTYYKDAISYGGNGTWYVEVGSLKGTSTSNITSAQYVEAGTETTTQSASVCASQSNLGWYDVNGAAHWGWTDGEGGAGIGGNNPPYAYWVETYKWLRDYDNVSC